LEGDREEGGKEKKKGKGGWKSLLSDIQKKKGQGVMPTKTLKGKGEKKSERFGKERK